MSWTKQQIVTQAFDEIGLAAYVFDLQAEQLQSALRKLDAMLATWNARGIRIGYPLPGSPEDSSLTEETGIPDAASEAVYLSLAVRLGPSYGKIVPLETKIAAKQAYDALVTRFITIQEFQLPTTLPAGAGNKAYSQYNTFIRPPAASILNGPDSELELN